MKNEKPTRKEILQALITLTTWATSGYKEGNPYCKPEVKQACEIIARERKRKNYIDWNE